MLLKKLLINKKEERKIMKINLNAVKDTFNKYSLNELAEVLNIHRSTISYYRNGRDFTKNLNLKQLSILTSMSNIDNEETIEIDSDLVKVFHANFDRHSDFYRSRNLTGYQVTAKEYKLLEEAASLSIEEMTLPMYNVVIKTAKFYQFMLNLDQDKILENLIRLASLTGKTYGDLAEEYNKSKNYLPGIMTRHNQGRYITTTNPKTMELLSKMLGFANVEDFKHELFKQEVVA